MYILISEKDITNAEVLARYHERLPDGRLIITPQELKTLGSIPECQIAATKAEVLAIMERQKAEGVTPPGREEETTEAADADTPAGTDTDAELPDNADGENTGENIGEPQETDDGETEAAGDEAEEGKETVGETTQDNGEITESNEETTITEEQDYGNDAGSGEL